MASGRLSNHIGVSIKEEKGDHSSGDDEEHRSSRKEQENIVSSKVGNKRKGIDEMVNPSQPKQKGFPNKQVVDATKPERSSAEGPNLIASSSTPKDNDDYHELESAKAEMSEVKEENQRLRMYLDQITKDYHNLQMQLNAISQQDPTRSKDITIPQPKFEEPEFVSLSLGRTASMDSKKRDEIKNKASTSSKLGQEHGNLSLRLDCKFDQDHQVSKSRSPPRDNNDVLQHPINISSPENSSFDEPRDREVSETTNWLPNKMPKTMSSVEHGELSQPTNVVSAKKARVSVRARCDTPTMNDGCQWRKYGQKISKGNPCPRAYYRCTVAPSCPVRKQVQRCAQDMSILITTYEGTHNHPLPIAATAMASTTSAAATMLLSGASTSRTGLLPSTSTSSGTTAADQLHGLNFYLSDNSKPNQFYYPNPSIQSSASSCPTITLDLTSSSSSSSAFSSHFNKLPNYPPPTQRYSSLNFSSLESSNTLPISWSNGQLTYGTNNASAQPSYNNTNSIIGSMNLGARQQQIPLQESSLYQSFMQKNNNMDTSHSSNTIKAITSDPSFQSALAAALTSIIGGGNNNVNNNHILNHNNHGGLLSENSSTFGQKLKWGEQFVPSTSSNNGNIINRPSSSSNNSQPSASLILLPPSSSSLPFSRPKSASTSPDESRDHEDN